MSLSGVDRKEIIIFLVGILASRVGRVNSENVDLTCDDFQDQKDTNCSCTLQVPALNNTEGHFCFQLPGIEAYLVVAEKPFGGEDSLFDKKCLCRYDDITTGHFRQDSVARMPGVRCSIRTLQQNEYLLQMAFPVSEEDDDDHFVSCVLPCRNESVTVPVLFPEEPAESGPSLMVIAVAAGCSSFGLLLVLLALTIVGVKYQRKQAWKMVENRPTHPAPLPSVQNSGLIYMVDRRGLIVPVNELLEVMDTSTALPSSRQVSCLQVPQKGGITMPGPSQTKDDPAKTAGDKDKNKGSASMFGFGWKGPDKVEKAGWDVDVKKTAIAEAEGSEKPATTVTTTDGEES